MKMRPLPLVAATLLLSGAALQIARSAPDDKTPAPVTAPATTSAAKAMSVYDFKLKSLDGKDVDLSKYKGKALLIVNTASKCGFTPQYASLQKVSEKYSKAGLVVLGFPANNFGGQEPGTEAEIGEFCTKNYGVTFDMFSKVSVKGADKTPLFDYLTTKANPAYTGEIGWNFEKFLISRDGHLVNRFKSPVTPDSPEVTQAVEAELAKKAA